VYGADGAVHHPHRKHDLHSISQDHHPSKNSVQKTISCNSTSNAPDDGRMYPKHVVLRIHQLPSCIKLAFHFISWGRCAVKQPKTFNIYIAKRCFCIACLNKYMFRSLYRPSSGCTRSYCKADYAIYNVFAFVDEISFTSIKSAFKIITVVAELKCYSNINGINSVKNWVLWSWEHCSHPTTQRPTTATNHIQQNQRSTAYAVTHGLCSLEDGRNDARNLLRQKLIINFWFLHLVGFFSLFTLCSRCTVTGT